MVGRGAAASHHRHLRRDRDHAVHDVDVVAAAWTYRVFLVSGGLQVDLAFVPSAEFRALSPAFRLVSGIEQEPSRFPSPGAGDIIGMDARVERAGHEPPFAHERLESVKMSFDHLSALTA